MAKAKAKGKAAAKPASKAATDRFTSLASHPQAAPSIRRTKGVGGLVGFALAVLIGMEHSEPFASLALRALELGIAGYLVAWAASVAVWRRVLAAQATTVVRGVQEERRRRLAGMTGEEKAE